MGGIVSQNTNSNNIDSSSLANDGESLNIVSLEGAPKAMRLYQHAATSEVIVLYGQQISDPEIQHITGAAHLWHPLKLSEKQERYFRQLKIAVKVPTKNLIPIPQPSSAPASPYLSSTPQAGGTPRTMTAATSISTTAQRKTSISNVGPDSTMIEKCDDFEEYDITPVKILTPIDSPTRIHKYDAKLDVDYIQTADDPTDPLLRTVDRLRLVANNGGGGNYNRNRDNSMDDSQSSTDSKKFERSGEIKPTYPVMSSEAKPRRKHHYRKLTPQIYSIPSNTGNKEGGEGFETFYIDVRTRSVSTSMEIADAKPDAKAEAKMVKRRSSEKSNEDGGAAKNHGTINSGRSVRCHICSAIFYGVSANEALEDHLSHCAALKAIRGNVDELDASLRVKTLVLDNFFGTKVHPENNDRNHSYYQTLVDVTGALIGRVFSPQSLSPDLDSMTRLSLAIEKQLQLLDEAISRKSNDPSGSIGNSNPATSTMFQQVLTSRHVLTETSAKLKGKIEIVEAYVKGNPGIPGIPGINGFTIIKSIGKGGFGTVYLAKKNENDRLYAIKAMNKDLIRKSKVLRQIMRERIVMSQANKYSDYFVRLLCSFQNKDFLFLVMEYMPGGDCMTLLTHYKKFPEIVAQHYVAQVSVAVAHLHNFGVVHRDIKPDNIMITRRGHAKLGDFGLVAPYDWSVNVSLVTSAPYSNTAGGGKASGISIKSHANSNIPVGKWLQSETEHLRNPFPPFSPDRIAGATYNEEEEEESENSNSSLHYSRPKSHRRLNSRVGNYNYVCPEIVLGEEYDHTVDWWAVGVLCFHFLAGITPFEDEKNNAKLTMENIYLRKVNWNLLPDQISNECKVFLTQIFCPVNIQERLGYESSQQIFDHPFFYDIDFTTLFEDKGPLIPHLSNSPFQNNNAGITATTPHSNTSSTNTPEGGAGSGSGLSNSAPGSGGTAGGRKSQLTLTNADIPIYTLLTKEEISNIPNFAEDQITHHPISNRPGRSNQLSSSAGGGTDILEELTANDFPQFTFYG